MQPTDIKAAPDPFSIGYLDIQFLQQAPGLPAVFPSVAICGTQGGIQVWSLQVTITALLPRLWRSSSFVSSQRSPHCSAHWGPFARPFFSPYSTSQVALSWTRHELVMNLSWNPQQCSIHAKIHSLDVWQAHPLTMLCPVKFWRKLCP